MTIVNTSPPLGAATIGSSDTSLAPGTLAPDTRELFSIAAVATLVVVAHVMEFGPRLVASWLVASWLPASSSDATTVVAMVAARFGAWLLGAFALAVFFSLRWIPRAHQRLLEPSLIASWVTLAAAAATALTLNRIGAWPWRWASTSPDVAVALPELVADQHYLATALWFVCACLVVPLLHELFFRHAMIEFLRSKRVSSVVSVLVASVAFAGTFLATWPPAAASVQHAALAMVLGAVLGTLAVRAKRGRGLGLALIAHAAFVAAELGVLVYAGPTG